MKPINRALVAAIAVATLMPLSAMAQQTPPADTMGTAPMGTTTAPTAPDSTMPAASATATDSTSTTDSTAAPTTGMTSAAPSATAAVTTGATVFGSDGAPVGKIASVAGGNAVVDTGSRKATLALNAFGSGPQGPTITVTKTQLEDAVAKATPAAADTTAKPKKKSGK